MCRSPFVCRDAAEWPLVVRTMRQVGGRVKRIASRFWNRKDSGNHGAVYPTLREHLVYQFVHGREVYVEVTCKLGLRDAWVLQYYGHDVGFC